MFTIQNDFLSVDINEKGAELDRIYHKMNNLEYLWSADPAFWAKKSPVLFPIVGTLKDNRYFFEGKSYELSRHGFARESSFSVISQFDDSISFAMSNNEQTLARFPFTFIFTITYSLRQNHLSVQYEVKNLGESPLYFSVGGHPAFRVPLTAGTGYTDYYLEFSDIENAGRWLISKDGLIESDTEPLLTNTSVLPLTKELFYQDALVFKNLASETVSLKSEKSEHGLTLNFSGFPFLGLWAAKDSDFVCIEPWYGIADSVNSTQQLTEKEGINKLDEGELFDATWGVLIF